MPNNARLWYNISAVCLGNLNPQYILCTKQPNQESTMHVLGKQWIPKALMSQHQEMGLSFAFNGSPYVFIPLAREELFEIV